MEQSGVRQQKYEDTMEMGRTRVVARRSQTQVGKMGQVTIGRARHGEKSGPKWRGTTLVQKVFGLCASKTGTKIDESLQPEKMDTKQCQKIISESKSSKRRENGKLKGKKRRVTSKERKRLREGLEVGGFLVQKDHGTSPKKRMLEDGGALPKEDGDLLRENQAMHEETLSAVGCGRTSI